MKRLIPVTLLTAFLAGCAHDSPCVPVYDDQGRLVHTNTLSLIHIFLTHAHRTISAQKSPDRSAHGWHYRQTFSDVGPWR